MSVREGVQITVTGPPSRPELEAAVEEHLYRIGLEALHNSGKHARAAVLTVEVRTDRDLPLLGSDAEPPAGLVLRVRDDGAGFDPDAEHPGHLGQRTMRERADAIGARLLMSSSPGAGTTVEVRVPR